MREACGTLEKLIELRRAADGVVVGQSGVPRPATHEERANGFFATLMGYTDLVAPLLLNTALPPACTGARAAVLSSLANLQEAYAFQRGFACGLLSLPDAAIHHLPARLWASCAESLERQRAEMTLLRTSAPPHIQAAVASAMAPSAELMRVQQGLLDAPKLRGGDLTVHAWWGLMTAHIERVRELHRRLSAPDADSDAWLVPASPRVMLGVGLGKASSSPLYVRAPPPPPLHEASSSDALPSSPPSATSSTQSKPLTRTGLDALRLVLGRSPPDSPSLTAARSPSLCSSPASPISLNSSPSSPRRELMEQPPGGGGEQPPVGEDPLSASFKRLWRSVGAPRAAVTMSRKLSRAAARLHRAMDLRDCGHVTREDADRFFASQPDPPEHTRGCFAEVGVYATRPDGALDWHCWQRFWQCYLNEYGATDQELIVMADAMLLHRSWRWDDGRHLHQPAFSKPATPAASSPQTSRRSSRRLSRNSGDSSS